VTTERLETLRVVKPWGRDDVMQEFGPTGEDRIGEIWFKPSLRLDEVLVKFLFTSENLSVQVHPDDARSPTGRGKEECWLILEAKPGARIALGFSEETDVGDIPSLADDGSLADRLEWHEVEAGDFFYVPAGTVHAIGSGITLVEVQQNTDITYRLFDYGRPRELHVEEGARVSNGRPYPAALRRKVDPVTTTLLVDGPHFRLAQVGGSSGQEQTPAFAGPVQIVVLSGTVDTQECTLEPAQSAVVRDLAAISASPDARYLIAGLPGAR
tara:strand:+ start:1304 stop:2110 length:807 start_codon:yes stop_codon:yes gene_type:complete